MNAKLLQVLRIVMLVLGWLLIAGVLADIGSRFFLYRQGQTDVTGYLGSVAARFDLAGILVDFFSSLGNAFLAFLIAAVFHMIGRQAPVRAENAKRLMIVCCLSYLADTLTRVCSSAVKLSSYWQLSAATKSVGHIWFWFGWASSLFPALVPILYAASIFVLYTHFTKMVTFESEVA
jgi:hypothetical protein